MACQVNSLTFSHTFLQAVRAFIKNPVKAVSSERFIYLDIVVLLPLEVIEREFFIQYLIYLSYLCIGKLFRSKKALHRAAYLYITLLKIVVERISGKSSICGDHDDRVLKFLKQYA